MQRKAFTLIELLVVIAIVAILAAILFPVFAQAKAAAKNSANLSNLKQDAMGMLMYSGDVDDLFPQAMDANTKIPGPKRRSPIQSRTRSIAAPSTRRPNPSM